MSAPVRAPSRLTESQRRHRAEEAQLEKELAKERAQADLVRMSGENIEAWLHNPDSLRRAIVMHEVLGPPVSMR